MTDETTQTQQTLPKNDGAKQQPSNGPQGGKGPKKTGPAGSGSGQPRSTSRSSNRSVSRRGPNSGAADSGSESANAQKGKGSSGNDDKRLRGQSQSGGKRGGRGGGARSTSQGTRQGGGGGGNKTTQSTQPSDASAALDSLQRVIADLKNASSSPPSQTNTPQPSLAAKNSSLPLDVDAPVFKPGAPAYPSNLPEQPPRHRKAASLGVSSLTPSTTYSPNLGSTMEEDGIEEGEIPENAYQASHQRRSLSQSFNPPRFQALAAQQQQQEQSDALGPTGRPQLAPGFMFGARRRPSTNMSMGPPINEEDVGFQFPQQNANFENLEAGQRKSDERGDIHGIMAEQVSTICVLSDADQP